MVYFLNFTKDVMKLQKKSQKFQTGNIFLKSQAFGQELLFKTLLTLYRPVD